MLEEVAANNEKLNISIIGMLIISDNISTELFENTVNNVLLKGKLIASDEIKEVIRKMS